MVDVIRHSTQHFTDADLTAIATYLKSLPPGKDDLPMPAVAKGPAELPKDLFTSRGGLGYMQFCSDCHRSDGAGVKGLFPALAGNTGVVASNPTSLLHITLTGWETAETAAHPRVYTMPGFARLANNEVAEILTFVRTRWGNEGTPISTAQVKKMRDQLNPVSTDSSAFETPRLANLLAASNADQVVRGMRLHLQTKELLPDNVGNALNCTSCHLNAGTVADGSPFVGVSAFFPSYAPRAGKVVSLEERINGCFRRSMNGKPIPPQSADMQAMVAYFDWMKNNTKPRIKSLAVVSARSTRPSSPTWPMASRSTPSNARCATAATARAWPVPTAAWCTHRCGATSPSTSALAWPAPTRRPRFVKRNMPIGFHEKFPLGQGGLSDQEAVDVAAYFSQKPRPDFPDKVKDWPNGGKPVDARY
jgi:thiosulfate dehydrogenase